MPCGYKAKCNQPLSDRQKHQNRQWSSIRSTVERVLGVLKRNQARFMLMVIAYNIKRGVAVQVEMMAMAE